VVIEEERIEQEMCKEFYVYLYLDPRKMGEYRYGDGVYSFEYEPFYVGKGKDGRKTDHLNEAKRNYTEGNQLKLNVIRKIWKEGLEPIIIVYKDNLTEDEAIHQFEIPMIAAIGRRDKGLGPLTNLTDGGEGVSGYIMTEEDKLNQSINLKKYYKDPENRKKASEISKEVQNRPELKQKSRERGKKWTAEHPEHMKHMNEASRTPESIKKRADKTRGSKYNLSPEQIEKKRNDSKGNTNSRKLYIVTTPEGGEIRVKGLQIFCKENNVAYWAMHRVANGHKEHWHGWKARKM